MTDCFFQDAVAIDTNVFVHIRNKEWNFERHIHGLLGKLAEKGITLLIDDREVIQREYVRHVIPMMEGNSVDGAEVYLLQYFMDVQRQRKVAVGRGGRLMPAIKGVIFERSKDSDRTFVYVAFHEGKALISNDVEDIVNGPPNERTPRRKRLLERTKRFRPAGSCIFTSAQASAKIP